MVGQKIDNIAGGGSYTPQQIANSTLLTHQEKIALLQELKAKVTGKQANSENLGFSPEEIDQAIAEVKKHAQDDGITDVDISIGRQSNA
ncbi:hypothetical protein [Mariluticola halotolerans]|uniref:hypothetical protein n=1 Tax=Mariluticola halotolerans TaxID=2909283 RepID=UPI0026E31760|nr:hypothetical protein [Mariluticola halotolerans]UJQ93003.1 hypothetical protein L1P08_08215 [Mariluticola halotolerans]